MLLLKNDGVASNDIGLSRLNMRNVMLFEHDAPGFQRLLAEFTERCCRDITAMQEVPCLHG